MPTYIVREYYSYYDEYEVEAEDERKAEELVEAFNSEHYPVTGVEQIAKKECEDFLDTVIYDEDRNLLV